MKTLNLGTWNIAAHDQQRRVGAIAEHLASREPGITILTEIMAKRALEKALTRALDTSYTLATIPTGSRYEDRIGLLINTPDCRIVDDVQAVPTGGDKMPYIMRTRLATPIGNVSLVAMRGAYVSGKGGIFSTGSAERKAQYVTAMNAAREDGELPIVGGDMNSSVRAHDPIFTQNGFRRLTTTDITWPDRVGIRTTTRDARLLSLPFLATGTGIALDAIYGTSAVENITSSAVATGLSDHVHLESQLALATGPVVA